MCLTLKIPRKKYLLRWYHEGLDAFETTSTTGQLLYKEFSADDLLEFISEHNCDEEELDPLLEQVCKTKRTVLRSKMEQGRDRLLELHSSGQGKSDKLAN